MPDTPRTPDHAPAPADAAAAAQEPDEREPDDAAAGPAGEVVCPTCGRPKPAGGCGCGQDTGEDSGRDTGQNTRVLPDGFTPLAARGDRPRLPLTGKP